MEVPVKYDCKTVTKAYLAGDGRVSCGTKLGKAPLALRYWYFRISKLLQKLTLQEVAW